MAHRSRRRNVGYRWLVLPPGVVVAAVAALIVWLALADDTSAEPATPAEVARDPQRFHGERVVVTAEIADVVGRSALILRPAELLVVDARVPAGIGVDDVVQVTGSVRPLRALIEDDPSYAEIEGLRVRDRPAIVADDVELEIEAESRPRKVTLKAILDGNGLIGTKVVVEAPVAAVLSPQTVVLTEPGVGDAGVGSAVNGVIIHSPARPLPDVTVTDTLRVTGVVRSLDDVELDADVRDIQDVYESWEPEPAVVASHVVVAGKR